MQDRNAIAVVGSGYVGLVAAMCFAEIGHSVICVDNDELKVEALRSGNPIIHETHLPELMARYCNNRVQFTTDLAEATRLADIIFIAVGTPQSESGNADLSYVEAVANEIARHIDSYKVIVEKSTVPVYTNEWIRRVIERNGVPRELFDVVSNPEFLREGSAVQDFLHPDRIVVGTDSQPAGALLKRLYEPLTSGTYYMQEGSFQGRRSDTALPPMLVTSTKSAEIIKHASNAFLAMKISFINAVSNLCEAADANVVQVAEGMGLDSRIGTRFLRPGIGYGGSCFPKDVAAFRYVAEQMSVDFSLLKEVERMNEQQKTRFVDKVRSAIWTLRGKHLAVLGLAFKGDTDDIRESPAIDIVQALLAEGCMISAYDPAAMMRAVDELPVTKNMMYAKSVEDAACDADALLILTEWPEFARLNLQKLKTALRYPIIVDGRNLYDPPEMEEAGFTYLSVGRPAVIPKRKVLEIPVHLSSDDSIRSSILGDLDGCSS